MKQFYETLSSISKLSVNGLRLIGKLCIGWSMLLLKKKLINWHCAPVAQVVGHRAARWEVVSLTLA